MKAGQGLSEAQPSWRKDADGPRKSWNLEETPTRDVYKLLTSAIVPRPIALTSSLSSDGVPNLAPFSYFSMVSSNPPMPQHFVYQAFVEAANITSVEASEVDEWIVSGLTMEPSVKPARVKESAFSMECELHSYQDITPVGATEPTVTVVLGLIRHCHAMESVLDSDGARVDSDKLQVVARMGGDTYSTVVEGFDVARPKWKDLQAVYFNLLGKKRDG
ncbi:flavoprotein oxygenase [Armillaria mellea]|nr:flavoprotein oxygenase [Armillaria mellea]